MRGIKSLTAIMVIMTMILSGCSLLLVEEDTGDTVCVSRSELEDLGIDVDALLAEEEPAGEEPADEEPADEEPADEEPADEKPADDIPVRTFTAGELVSIEPRAASEDITFTYSEPLDENGQWQTTTDDVGEYVVDVTGTNPAGSVTKQIRIVILPGNRAPVITGTDELIVVAGDTVELDVTVDDPDGDDVTVSYSGWMTSDTKETTEDDIGEQTVIVTASDGVAEATMTIVVNVIAPNNPPVIQDIDPITVTEGDFVQVDAAATDPDGDDVVITFSDPLDEEGEWQTETGDSGTYSVTATASDGELQDTTTFTIIVEAANTAPEISHPAVVDVTVTEGQSALVELTPEVSDADGDEVTVTYSGFMTSSTQNVTEDDEGSHIVTITASDGIAQTSIDVTINVEVNSPPEFDF